MIPHKRRIIRTFTREHVCARNFRCDHCDADIYGRYVRIVAAIESKRYPALEVYRHCAECA